MVDASPRRFQQGGAGHVGRSFRHVTNGATRCSQGGLVGVQPLEKKREELIVLGHVSETHFGNNQT